MKSLFYRFIKLLIKTGLYAYFNKIEINGLENIPDAQTPFIYAPNHQGAFMDALIVGALAEAPAHYLTRSDIFVTPFLWPLDALNMIPIYRMRDGFNKLSKNEAIFETCYQLLEQNKPILIFPEGNQGRHYYLRNLTKGTVRLALQAQEKSDKPIKVLPVGINYFRHDHPGYKLILNYGAPLNVSDYIESYLIQKPKTLNQFRTDLSEALKKVMFIPDNSEDYENKKWALSRKNEKLNFDHLKETIQNGNYSKQKYYAYLRPLMSLLWIPNFGVAIVSYFTLNHLIKDVIFRSSMKIAIGVFIFPIWWLISFLLIFNIFGFSTAILVFVFQISSLFIRQWIGRLVR